MRCCAGGQRVMSERALRVNAVIFRDHLSTHHEKMFELIDRVKSKRVGNTWKDIAKNTDAVLQNGIVIIRENYGRAANKTRIFWNPTDGVIDYFFDRINRRMAWDDFISESVHIHLDQELYFVERIQRTIDRNDPQGTAAVYETMTLIDGAWYMPAPLYQSVALSGYNTRAHRFFPFTDFENTWHSVEVVSRPIRTCLAPDERFMSNRVEWFIELVGADGRSQLGLRRAPTWLAELLPSPVPR
jgi:hypothetical protein